MSELWLVGSDDVVRAVLAWRQTSQAADPGKETLLKLTEILITMRKDLGDTSTKIEARDLLGLFVNDIDTVTAHAAGECSPLRTARKRSR